MAHLDRLRIGARRLEVATTLALILLPIAILAALILAPPSSRTIAEYFPGIPVAEGTRPVQIRAALAVGLVTAALLMWILDRMRRLFGLYRRGIVLTADCARLIRQIGTGLALVAAARILATPLQTVILTANAPPGQRQVALSLSSDAIGLLLAAGLITLIGWAMAEAARIDEENRGFV